MSRRDSGSFTPLKHAISISSRRSISSKPSSLSKSSEESRSLTADHVDSKALSKISMSSGSNRCRSDRNKFLTPMAVLRCLRRVKEHDDSFTNRFATRGRRRALGHAVWPIAVAEGLNPLSYRFSRLPPPCKCTNVLGYTAALAVNDALQSAMLFAKPESLPNFRSAALDEVFAIRIRPYLQIDGSLICEIATVQLHEAQDRISDLIQLPACLVRHRQVEKQMAVLNI